MKIENMEVVHGVPSGPVSKAVLKFISASRER